ncbi:MAG: glycoside hydrolase family 26 protein [Oscillospiraceae bacterium]|nr:glycoside hydrolase family 26 protein [Oscillospiraceae bacterium]
MKTLNDNNSASAKISKVRFISKDESILPNIYPGEFAPKASFVREGTVEVEIQQVQIFDEGNIYVCDVNQTVFITVKDLHSPISVLDYFYLISDKATLTAMHNNDHDNLSPSGSTERIYNDTGVVPAIWSNDFLYNAAYANERQRQAMIDEMIKQWNNGAIVQLLLHVAPPTVTPEDEIKGVPWSRRGGSANAVQSDLTDEQWVDLLTEGGVINANWKRRLDVYAKYMHQLKESGVVFLFRPFHEMNQHVFWWGGRPKTTLAGNDLRNTTADLYCMTRDYLEKEKGLDNIIWVWDMQDLGASYGNSYQTPYDSTDWQQFNPGNDYWDIFALDIYDNANGTYTAEKYSQAKKTAKGKPFAIGECYVLPNKTEQPEQSEWVFFMPWGKDTWEHNAQQKIREAYQSNLSIADTPRFSSSL